MTEAQQRRFYFPAWRRCAEANRWLMLVPEVKAGAAGKAWDPRRREAGPRVNVAPHLVGRRGPAVRRLGADLGEQRAHALANWPEPARDAMLSVLDYAEQLARQEHRAVTDADLRHGCNLTATAGQRASSGALSNKDLNRVVVLFRLLEEPEDLDAVMEWLHPEIADRESLKHYLKKLAPEATLVAIARNAYDTIFWEDLEEAQLRWMVSQVKGRREIRSPKSEVRREYEEGPF